MAVKVDVYLWGTKVGSLGYDKSGKMGEISVFEFTAKVMNEGINISPLLMNSQIQQHHFTNISYRTFKGLAGVFSDSLPDKFGDQLIDIYMAEKGIVGQDITPLDRLMYIGDRGMGAIEYVPNEVKSSEDDFHALDITMLNELASLTNNNQSILAQKLHESESQSQALKFIRIGASAGGARSKALVAKKDAVLKDGTVNHGVEYNYYLLKFDTDDNSDRDGFDAKGMTRVEYVYSVIARRCGINIPNTEFIVNGNDFHFLIERFDRIKVNNKLEKLHYVSWCGIAHAHRDETGAYSYEQLSLVCKQLGLGADTLKEVFTRCVFNIVGVNQDDHTKNFGFLMNKDLEWSLSPAFDMTYSYDPSGKWTSKHQIKLNRKQSDFVREDLLNFAIHCNLTRLQASNIINLVIQEFADFESLADEYNVPKALKMTISKNLRRHL